jgi:hypothetical protein
MLPGAGWVLAGAGAVADRVVMRRLRAAALGNDVR